MVEYSDTGGGKMSYAAVIHYVYEKDTSVTLRSERMETEATIGGSVNFYFYDFETEGVKHYVKYAVGNGEIFFRGNVNDVSEDRIYAGSMVLSESQYYSHWFVFCTDDENEILGDHYLDAYDIVDEIFLSLDGIDVNTRGSENTNSISITNGATSESFASYGSTFSPTLSCDIFNCEFTERLISGEFYDNVVKGTIVNAWYVITGQENYPMIMGRFVVRDEPTFTEETVSFNGIGITEAYIEMAWTDIKQLNLYHQQEIEEKYVTNGFMDFVEYRSDVYFWEFLPEDFYRTTGCSLHIDHWGSIKQMIYDYKIPQLMIPCLESYSQTQITDDDGNLIDYDYEKEYTPQIRWRELLSGIAILLRANVIEKNGAFYIKQLPDVKQSGYREIFDSSSYDNSAQFGRKLMCPSDISVNGTNWYFYRDISIGNPVGFGYYTGEATVTINSKKSDEAGVTYYPVSIECPWILFETMDRNPQNYRKQSMYLWLGHDENMQWQTALSRWNKAFTYHKANYQTVGWHPAMMAGEMNIVEDYDGEKRYAYIGEITVHYDGDVYADISSPCDAQADSAPSVSTFSLARGINDQAIKVENVSSSGGYAYTAYSSNDKANQQGMRSQTSVEIKEIVTEIEKSLVPSAYEATIPYFEFGGFIDESMNVTLTEVTE